MKDNDKKIKRTSFDLTMENSNALGAYSEKIGGTYSRVVNYMLRIFLKLHPNVQANLVDFCNQKIEEMTADIELMNGFALDEAKKIRQQYQEIAYFLLAGEENTQKEADGMRKIYLKEGYVIVPNRPDWVILDNLSNPSDCMYAGVVETRQPLTGDKVYNAKHYVFFSNYKYGSDYPAELYEKVYDAAVEKDADFKIILNATVKPVYKEGSSKTSASSILNLDAYKAAPCPGLFCIAEQGDPLYWNPADPNYEPPFGAMIIRK